MASIKPAVIREEETSGEPDLLMGVCEEGSSRQMAAAGRPLAEHEHTMAALTHQEVPTSL